jgi:hypothetical protein
MAAFDYFYLDGKYLHSVQAVANSMLHFLAISWRPESAGHLPPTLPPTRMAGDGHRNGHQLPRTGRASYRKRKKPRPGGDRGLTDRRRGIGGAGMALPCLARACGDTGWVCELGDRPWAIPRTPASAASRVYGEPKSGRVNAHRQLSRRLSNRGIGSWSARNARIGSNRRRLS